MTDTRVTPGVTTTPALEVTGLRVSYAGHEVLHGVDLRVGAGVTAVLGPSGCGKTTLLRVVAGFVAPAAGRVVVGGRQVAGGGRPVPPRERGIGYVPQEGALFPHLSVAANIAFGLPRAERRGPRVAELLDLVELPRTLADRHPHQLSGGQQQRVALARALAPHPALVLLDEPFSSLDAGLRDSTGRAVVRALLASGAAALLVTHDQREALSLADEVAVMSQGAFLQVASPDLLCREPAGPEVAAFLGRAGLVDGEVVLVEPDGAVQVRLASGDVLAARLPGTATAAVGTRVHLRVDGAGVAFPDAGPQALPAAEPAEPAEGRR